VTLAINLTTSVSKTRKSVPTVKDGAHQPPERAVWSSMAVLRVHETWVPDAVKTPVLYPARIDGHEEKAVGVNRR
jgi:hypothetical protein